MGALELYLIRHGLAGEADPAQDDRLRPLTHAGVRRTQAVAKRLLVLGLRFDLLLSSPLVRARQTGDLFHSAGLCGRPEESPELAPGGNFKRWLGWLRQWRRRGDSKLALVGHMPDLAEWAETLVFGEPGSRLVVKKAGVLGLTLPPRGSPVGRSLLFLHVPPRYLV